VDSRSDKNSSAIGHDPLAWIAEDEAGDDPVLEPVADTVSIADTEPTPTVVEDDASVVILQGAASIVQVAKLRGRLVAALEKGDAITLDLSSLIAIDVATLQMLYAFSLEAAQQNIALQWQGVSKKVAAVAKDIGMIEALAWGDIAD